MSAYGAGGSNNVTPANNLWKYISGSSPDEIELNSAAGVTGVDAVLPTDSAFSMILKTVAGFGNALWLYISGSIMGFSGITEDGGGVVISQEISDANTGDRAVVSVSDTSFAANLHAEDGATESDYTLDKLQVVEQSIDLATDDSVVRTLNKDSHEIEVNVGGVVAMLQVNDKDEFRLEQGGGVKVFAVLKDGKIETNQIVAAGVHPTIVGEIELFDAATGLSVGFVEVKNL